MVIIRNREEIPAGLASPVVTVGNFDGVHRGHREIFRRVRAAAAELGGVSVVITFIPHPLKVLTPERDFRLITTYAEKERLIAEAGVDYLITLPFSPEFASIPADEFVRGILVGAVGMKRLIIGYDYAFGRNREGDVELLRRLGGELGFDVEVLEQVGDGKTGFSSSMVRERIAQGDMAAVAALLGRYYSVRGKVVHGRHLGRKIGFPTANLETEEELLPRPGVYAVRVEWNLREYDGACNIGDNPTVQGTGTTVEVHLLDFDGDLYGCTLKVHFIERVREERKFPDLFALMRAIRSDVDNCREILSRVQPITRHG